MKCLLIMVVAVVSLPGIICPPVNHDPVGDSDEEEDTGLEYDKYLREVVMTLEEDEGFRKKLEETNITDIKNGKIAMYLDMVTHHIREKLDEIKRREITRLKSLAREKMREMNGIQRMDQYYPHHVDVKNPHSFEMKDLEHLIKKATADLDELDKRRREEFKEYEMQKEHEKREDLEQMKEEDRQKEQQKYDEMKKKHQEHPRVHHPGSKQQLEDVWEKSDHMDSDDFQPKTFFRLHDIDGNDLLDEEEIEALFQKELDQVYDPNLPEDDMKERYEEMSRMREHVFKEVDTDKDRMISLSEFMKYADGDEFEKDEGWETLDQQQQFTEEEYREYEHLMREREEMLRRQGVGMGHQPGMDPHPRDPNVEHMQMGMPQHGMPPQGMPQQGMPQQGMPQQGMPQHRMPQHGMPQHGMPQQGMPQQGMPQQGMPQQGMPPQGMPPQGMPPQGMPPQGMPPQQGIPQQHQGIPPQQGKQQQQNLQFQHGQAQGAPVHQQGMMPGQGGNLAQPAHHDQILQQQQMAQQQQQQILQQQQQMAQHQQQAMQQHQDQVMQHQQMMQQHHQQQVPQQQQGLHQQPIVQAQVQQPRQAKMQQEGAGQVHEQVDTNPINAQPAQVMQGEGQPIAQADGEGQPIVQAQGEGQPIVQAHGEGQPIVLAHGEGQPIVQAPGEGQQPQ